MHDKGWSISLGGPPPLTANQLVLVAYLELLKQSISVFNFYLCGSGGLVLLETKTCLVCYADIVLLYDTA